MAEEFYGVTELHKPIKPEQDKLKNDPPAFDPSDISAMDAAAKELMDKKAKEQAEADAQAEADRKAAEEAAAAEAAKTDEQREAERKAAEEAAAIEAAKTDEEREAERKAAEEAAAAEAAKTDEEKEAERKAAEEAEAAKKAAEGQDPYPDVTLPPNARGKSAEAFATVKQRFAADLSKRDEEIAKLRADLEQTKAALKDPVPEETKQELEDLRLFRARLDVQADPEFTKKYDGKISTLNEFIYDQLKTSGTLSDDGIKKIRELGGLHKVNYEDILKSIESPHVLRLVQGKLDEIAVTRFEQQRAVEAAKEDIQKYVKERQEAYEKSLTAHHEATKVELEKIHSTKMPWLNDPEPPKTQDANSRAIYDDTVKFNNSVKENMAIATADDSPEMRAILIAGMGQLLWLKRQFEIQAAVLKSSEAARKEAETQLAKIKKASVTKLRESNAPPSGGAPKPKIDYNTTAAEALDAHRKAQLGTA